MQFPLHNTQGEVVGQIELSDDVFGVPVNVPVMHQAYVRQMANARVGTADTKTRGEVAGGGRKPWKQKGTGRARQGSTRAPHFRKGGVVFGPHPRSYEQAMPRKMRRLALKSALSSKVLEDRLVVLDALQFDTPKTKAFADVLTGLGVGSTALVLLSERDEIVERSAGNLHGVKTLRASYLNIRDLLGFDYVIMPRSAVELVESFLG